MLAPIIFPSINADVVHSTRYRRLPYNLNYKFRLSIFIFKILDILEILVYICLLEIYFYLLIYLLLIYLLLTYLILLIYLKCLCILANLKSLYIFVYFKYLYLLVYLIYLSTVTINEKKMQKLDEFYKYS